MKSLIAAAAVLVLAGAVTSTADAQIRAMGAPSLNPGMSIHTPAGVGRPGPNPSLSLSAPTSTPLQAQMREDYATQLRQEQSQLLQQNSGGDTRQEMAIGHELNNYLAPR